MSEKIYTIEEIKEKLKNTSVNSVILFGSYAKNTATKKSDLDLIIDSEETLLGFKLYSLLTQIEYEFEKKVDEFEKSEIQENSKIDEEIKKKGVLVYKK